MIILENQMIWDLYQSMEPNILQVSKFELKSQLQKVWKLMYGEGSPTLVWCSIYVQPKLNPWNNCLHDVNTAIRQPITELSEITRREYCRENPLIERTRSEIPDFIRMRKQTLADQLIPSWREPQQMHLKTHTAPRSSNKRHELPSKNEITNPNHLVFFFEAESTREETGMICIRFYIRNASRLVQSKSLQIIIPILHRIRAH